MTDQVKY